MKPSALLPVAGIVVVVAVVTACGGGIATEPPQQENTSADASAPPPTSDDPAPPAANDPAAPAPATKDAAAPTACTPPPPPASIAPLPGGSASSGAWGDAKGNTPPLTIDLAACASARWFAWLPLGSAWVRIAPSAASAAGCDVWLGGESEDPSYAGSASQYCSFPASCSPATLTVTAGQGGPAHVDVPAYCTP